ncbi:hypothetical protein CR513_14691, partial [Mucuna pruriens]
MVIDALSRNSLHISSLMVNRDMNLSKIMILDRIKLCLIRFTNYFQNQICEA